MQMGWKLALMALYLPLAWAEPACPAGSLQVGSAPPAGYEQKCVLPDGKAHGLWRTWYPNGQLMSEVPMDHGREHGDVRSWWPNGQLMMRGQSIHGNRYRQFEYWDIQGNPRHIATETTTTVIPADDVTTGVKP